MGGPRKEKAGASKPAAKNTKTKKDPNAPKKPLTAYFLFSAAKREEVKKGLPSDAKVTMVAKKLGEMWGALDDKSEWTKKAAKAKANYEKEMEAYEGGDTKGTKAKKRPSEDRDEKSSKKKRKVESSPERNSESEASEEEDSSE